VPSLPAFGPAESTGTAPGSGGRGFHRMASFTQASLEVTNLEGGTMPDTNAKKTCFVVMGFGEKTDFQSNPQRVLNLNKTFEYIIQPAAEESGLKCIRADKIIHSTVIDSRCTSSCSGPTW
jgi:hypothetical protein